MSGEYAAPPPPQGRERCHSRKSVDVREMAVVFVENNCRSSREIDMRESDGYMTESDEYDSERWI